MDETEKKETKADRGNPSVMLPSKGQQVFMGIFFCLLVIAMISVVRYGNKGTANQPIVTHEDIAFKTSSQSSGPYIKPDTIEKPAQTTPTMVGPDPLTLQREQFMQTEALRMAQERQKQQQKRLQSPQLVFDQSTPSPTVASASAGAGVTVGNNGSLTGGGDAGDANLAFAAQASNQGFETSHAARMKNLNTLIAQGTMISGILETAIQSDLPGMTRAVVSDDIYSFDGSTLLIPKGSKLVGQYRSGLVRGQSRVFVIWNRLLRNDGVTVNLGSFGTDSLGRSGLNGAVDTHFFERFGSSVLLSMIDTSLQIVANNSKSNASSTVAVETGKDFNRAAEIALENSVAIPPTVNIAQGKRINVFVGKDLDFSQVNGKTADADSP
jgi:type IV secretion system protein VirB10